MATLVGIATFLVAFIITNVAYLEWAIWRYPKANSMAGLSGFVLGLEIAFVCALVAFLLYLRRTRPASRGGITRTREQIPFSPDHETAKVAELLNELFTHVLYDEEPLYISDEATIWDVSMSDPKDILNRLSLYYRIPVALEETRQPLWRFLRTIQHRRQSE